MNTPNINYNIKRYDLSQDKSLKAWNASDEYLIQTFKNFTDTSTNIGIYNDRFGFLGCHLYLFEPTIIITNKSQEKAINSNLKANSIHLNKFSDPLSKLEFPLDLALIKIPKSFELFDLFLYHITHNSLENIKVICGFMTRHFSPRLIEIANKYFEVAEQSKAHKKARVLILSKRKSPKKTVIINSLTYKDRIYKQYWGVFSSDHIDYATQFLLNHIEVKKDSKQILDLASGNGIIANEVYRKQTDAEIHLLDDSILAVSSAKMNIRGENIYHHYNNELSIFDDESFDLVVTNPPFHFEYEINIHIPISLFKGCQRVLKKGGNLQIVANKHLNYKVHLDRIFGDVSIAAIEDKFILYKCIKH